MGVGLRSWTLIWLGIGLLLMAPRAEAGTDMEGDSSVDTLKAVGELKWQNRVILVWPEGDARDEIAMLDGADPEIADRHILWFVLGPDSLTTNYPSAIGDDFVDETAARYRNEKESVVILVGKDGGVKRRSVRLDLDDLFALIDTMPMRRSEMEGGI
jgi:hypothetical protein